MNKLKWILQRAGVYFTFVYEFLIWNTLQNKQIFKTLLIICKPVIYIYTYIYVYWQFISEVELSDKNTPSSSNLDGGRIYTEESRLYHVTIYSWLFTIYLFLQRGTFPFTFPPFVFCLKVGQYQKNCLRGLES